MNYSKKLKSYREKNDLTQLQMAIKLGCSLTAYSNWEKGISVGTKFAEKIEEMLKEKGE